MSHCRFCDKVVLLRDVHAQCQKKYDSGKVEIRRIIRDAIFSGKDLSVAQQQSRHLAGSSFISDKECVYAIGQGWDMALDRCLEDGRFSPDEMRRMQDAARRLSLSPELLKYMGVEQKLLAFKQVQARRETEQQKQQSLARNRQQALDLLRRGQFPKYPYPTPTLPFLFGMDQWLLWLFEGVEYHEEKKRRKTVRDSQGMSYHGAYAGRSESRSVEWSEMVLMGTGMVALTSKCFFFSGTGISLRIPYSKIITVKPYDDALEIMKDGVAAKRQVFHSMDGCFAYDLLKAIER